MSLKLLLEHPWYQYWPGAWASQLYDSISLDMSVALIEQVAWLPFIMAVLRLKSREFQFSMMSNSPRSGHGQPNIQKAGHAPHVGVGR